MKLQKQKKEIQPISNKWDKADSFDELVHELLQDKKEKIAFIKVLKEGNNPPEFIKDVLTYYDA